jgi:hypothetical protein
MAEAAQPQQRPTIPGGAICTRCNKTIRPHEPASYHVPDRPTLGGTVFYHHTGPCPGRAGRR